MARRLAQISLWTIGLAAALVLVVGIGGRLWLGASQAVLDGEVRVAGLGASVTIARDAHGVPRITAASRTDLARAIGFLHAQERFFQMDLQRRQPAGELAALVGTMAVPLDRQNRPHRFRALASQVLARMPADERADAEAYAAGVNAGLAALGARPFEYIALRTTPDPWHTEDSILVLLAMWSTLQGNQFEYEVTLGTLADLLPEPAFEFLAGRATEWERPVDGLVVPVPAIPGADVYDLRRAPVPKAARVAPAPPPALPWWGPLTADESAAIGSNNWAVSGARSTTGSAIVANDMHLRLGVPNIWFRATFEIPDEARPGATRTISGVTLPGGPQMVVGSNGDIAWGFTNTGGDWSDVVLVEPAPGDPTKYRTPDGPRAFDVVHESIAVKGGTPVDLEVRSTIWGPVLGTDHRGRALAHRWAAHDVAVLASDPARIGRARTVDEALQHAVGASTPAQNLVVGDRSGRIAWTIHGAVPRRVGYRGDVPTSWADGAHRWDGYLHAAEHPRVVDPPDGLLWTANARVVGGEMAARIGDGGFADGIRAWMIRDRLGALDRTDEAGLLAIQLDDRALFHERWRTLLLDVLGRPASPSADAAVAARRAEAQRIVETAWSGRAAAGDAAYRLVRTFRGTVQRRAFDALTAPVRAAAPDFDHGIIRRLEGPLWKLVTERPAHLLDPAFASWEAFLLDALDRALAALPAEGGLAARTWGESNRADFVHPLAGALPFAGRWLNMPRAPLDGDIYTPRVTAPRDGASERMVVSPGHEASGMLHMPGGQSGHPLSPHYADQQDAWVRGEALPLLPGPPVHTLTLAPAR